MPPTKKKNSGKPAATVRRPRPKRRQRKRSWLSRHSGTVTIGVLVAVVAGWFAWYFALSGYGGDTAWIYIPEGATEQSVADSLRINLGASAGDRVYMLWRLQGGYPAKSHGAYRADHGRSIFSLSRAMAKGRETPVRVSFTGVRTLDDLARRVTNQLSMSAGEFVEACSRVLPAAGYDTPEKYPAAFIPDTYEFYWAVSPDTLVARLARNTARFWTDERRLKARKLGLDPVGVATIASIVEEETAKPDERPKVARLYLNRLKQGMKLQADPTVKFAVGDPTLRRITLEHLKVNSPYNTYRVAGLPPGPIRVAEKSTLDAVLDAPAHPYIYMCAKEDFSGYHNFSTSYEQHLKNAAAYQAELNRRNIR